jgi:hypothetical protein
MLFYRATACVVFALGLILSSNVFSDDDHEDGNPGEVEDEDKCEETKIEISGPVDAVDLEATPATITVYGLVIDLSKVTADMEEMCGCLKAGSWVKLKLESDTEPLIASELKLKNGYDTDDATIKAPLQAVDATAMTVTVLGLTIDVSTAKIEGAVSDNKCEDADLTQLAEGQYVKVELDVAKLPELVATKVEVKNYVNEIVVEVECGCSGKIGLGHIKGKGNGHHKGHGHGHDCDDHDGDDDDDDDDDGGDGESEVVEIKITVDVKVTKGSTSAGTMISKLLSKGGKAKAAKSTKKTVTLKAVARDGKAVLRGVPAGRAKIVANRVGESKAAAKKNLKITSGSKQTVALKLK